MKQAVQSLNRDEIEAIKEMRELGRKSLFYLCTQLLGYTDVDPVLHRPFIEPLDALVKDVGGVDSVDSRGNCAYVPDEETMSVAIPHDIMRNYMLLAFRGSLKTSINTMAHIVQLILNFPHIAILLYHNTEDKAKLILKEIVDKFQLPRMMQLYPEFAVVNERMRRKCMSQENKGFTTPARYKTPSDLALKKEPTVTAHGLATSSAGQHVSVIKMTDVVEDVNSTTIDMCKRVYKQVNMALNLLEDPECFVFLEGTPYRVGDTYYEIEKLEWWETKPEDRSYHIVHMPVFEIETNGRPRTFSPDEAKLPWKVATEDKILSPFVTQKKGERISMWPTWRGGQRKFTYEKLMKMQRKERFQFSCQQLLRPSEEGDSILNEDQCYREFPRNQVYQLHQRLILMAVDTAETDNPKTSNDTAMTVALLSKEGLRVVLDGFVGMPQAEEIVELMFEFNEKYKPDIIFLEETSFVRGLKPTISLHELKNQKSLPLEYVKREPFKSKKDRIRGALRAPMSAGQLVFVNDINPNYLERVKDEMNGFPRDHRDDVLDTLVDIVSANADLTSYANPKTQEAAKRHKLQEIQRNDYQKWVDKWAGRGPLPNEMGKDRMRLGM